MPTTLLPQPRARFFDNNGNPLSGGKVLTYAAGTSTPLATYTDYSGLTANPTTVILDANGEANIWLANALYKIVLQNSASVVQWTVDNVGDISSVSQTVGFGQATDIGSANLVDLGSVATHFAYITGTTSISSFGSTATLSLPLYLIKFESALTLNNSASLIVPGGVSITTSAQDHAFVEYLGSGTWRIIEYMRADGAAVNSVVSTTTFSFTGDITPAQLTANADNYAPTGIATSSTLRISSDASRNITGIDGGTDGRILILANVGTFPIILKHDATSTAANRFFAPNSTDFTIRPNSNAVVQYDSTSSRWRVMASSSGIASASDVAAGTDNSLAIPAGLSAKNLISSVTAAASANVVFSSGLTSTYSTYLFEMIDLKPATDDVSFNVELSTDGGATYLSSGYQYQVAAQVAGAGAFSEGSTAASFIRLTKTAGGSAGVGNAANESYSGLLHLFAPADSVNAKKLTTEACYYNAAGTVVYSPVVGSNNTTSPVNAIRFTFSSGNIASGTIRMFGIR